MLQERDLGASPKQNKRLLGKYFKSKQGGAHKKPRGGDGGVLYLCQGKGAGGPMGWGGGMTAAGETSQEVADANTCPRRQLSGPPLGPLPNLHTMSLTAMGLKVGSLENLESPNLAVGKTPPGGVRGLVQGHRSTNQSNNLRRKKLDGDVRGCIGAPSLARFSATEPSGSGRVGQGHLGLDALAISLWPTGSFLLMRSLSKKQTRNSTRQFLFGKRLKMATMSGA